MDSKVVPEDDVDRHQSRNSKPCTDASKPSVFHRSAQHHGPDDAGVAQTLTGYVSQAPRGARSTKRPPRGARAGWASSPSSNRSPRRTRAARVPIAASYGEGHPCRTHVRAVLLRARRLLLGARHGHLIELPPQGRLADRNAGFVLSARAARRASRVELPCETGEPCLGLDLYQTLAPWSVPAWRDSAWRDSAVSIVALSKRSTLALTPSFAPMRSEDRSRVSSSRILRRRSTDEAAGASFHEQPCFPVRTRVLAPFWPVMVHHADRGCRCQPSLPSFAGAPWHRGNVSARSRHTPKCTT